VKRKGINAEKFDYSLIPDPMENFEHWNKIPDDLMESIIETREDIKAAIKAFEKIGDLSSIFLWLGLRRQLPFVVDNYRPLVEKGILEEALVRAFSGARFNNSNIQQSTIDFMLYQADKEKMLSLGLLPEEKDTYTLYRGISGKGAARRKYGHSWTGTLDIAIWFAKRLSFDKPIVYRAEVPKDCICFYIDDRNEDEYVCLIPRDLKLVEVWRQEQKDEEVKS
jgi:hypothetical protein